MLLELQEIRKEYKINKSSLHVLENVSITFTMGKCVAIIGENGTGKSTLLKIIAGLISYDRGRIFYDDIQIHTSERKRRLFLERYIGYIPQNYALIAEWTVFDNVALPLKCRHLPPKKMRQEVQNILKLVNLSEKSNQYVFQLSGGERQRVAIARALIKKPKIILADEPTGALDKKTEETLIHNLINLKSDNRLVIAVTHNLEIAEMFDEIIQIKNGTLTVIKE